jgi:two-component system, LuxR family, response regulator FixJ
MECKTVFIVSEDSALRDSLSELVTAAGLRAETCPSFAKWLEAVQPEQGSCLVLDAEARDFTGPERLARFASVCARVPVLLLIDRGDVPIAVRAIRDGAVDVLEKPYRNEKLIERIMRVAAARQDTLANK